MLLTTVSCAGEDKKMSDPLSHFTATFLAGEKLFRGNSRTHEIPRYVSNTSCVCHMYRGQLDGMASIIGMSTDNQSDVGAVRRTQRDWS